MLGKKKEECVQGHRLDQIRGHTELDGGKSSGDQEKIGDWEFGTADGGLAIQGDEHDRMGLEVLQGKGDSGLIIASLSDLLSWRPGNVEVKMGTRSPNLPHLWSTFSS